MLKVHILVLCLALLGAGCSNYSGNAYSGSAVRGVQTIRYGKVISTQPVVLHEEDSGVLGALGGGVVGGIVGSTIGGGKGKIFTTLAGTALGMASGYMAEGALTKQKGLEISVRMDNGEDLSIVQAADEHFFPGEAVRVLLGADGSARVSKNNNQ